MCKLCTCPVVSARRIDGGVARGGDDDGKAPSAVDKKIRVDKMR